MDWQTNLIKDFNGDVTIKENKIVFKTLPETIVIPSRRFPLNNQYQIFCTYNTENFIPGTEFEKLCMKAMDQMACKVGQCYTNSENLIQVLKSYDIEAETYVGWTFIGNTYPIHHCFIVVDGNKVLDFGAFLKSAELDELDRTKGSTSADEKRKIMAKTYLQKSKLKNHERFGFGKVDPLYCHIAAKCESLEGKLIFNKLMSEYPAHQSYVNMNLRNGSTVLQDKIREEERKG